MAHFPMFVNIKDRPCLVAGGGKVALRKVTTLLKYQADVRVTAPEICREIRDLLPRDHWRVGQVEDREMEEAFLVIAATASREENHRISLFCRERKIPVNVIDAPRECTFLFPAVVKRGEISIGINTGASSPGVSRHIRRQIEEEIPEYYGEIARQIGCLREELKEKVTSERKRADILTAVTDRAFSEERVLTPEELQEIIRQEMI